MLHMNLWWNAAGVLIRYECCSPKGDPKFPRFPSNLVGSTHNQSIICCGVFYSIVLYCRLYSATVTVNTDSHTQRRVQPDQCYFTVQITGINLYAVCYVIQQSLYILHF